MKHDARHHWVAENTAGKIGSRNRREIQGPPQQGAVGAGACRAVTRLQRTRATSELVLFSAGISLAEADGPVKAHLGHTDEQASGASALAWSM